jgi:flagellar hook-associated protein 1 FlgK
MSLNVSLNAALSVLNAAQIGIDLVSRNVGNAQSENYTKKIQQQVSRVVAGTGQGVYTSIAIRNVDLLLQRDGRNSFSTLKALDVKDEFLVRLEKLFGSPGEAQSVGGRITSLRQSFESLNNNPDQIAAQLAAIERGRDVVTTLNTLTTQIQAFRTQIDKEIETSVGKINTALSNIATLNAEIGTRSIAGQSSADLEDQRDKHLKDLAEQMGFSTFTRSNGAIAVLTENNRFLVDVSATTVSFTPRTTIVASDAYVPTGAPAAGFNATLNGVTIPNPAGGANIDFTSSITRGRLDGLFELRDTILPQAQAQLDELAAVMTVAFEGTGTGYAGTAITMFTDGTAGGPPVAQFTNTAANRVGYSGRIALQPAFTGAPWRIRDGTNSTAVPTQSANRGDLTQIRSVLTMFETAQTTFTASAGLGTTATVEQYANSFTGFNSNLRAENIDKQTDRKSLTDAFDKRLQDMSGVNVDDELGRMVALQNSYSASARVITTVTAMLDELIELGR